MTDGAVQYSAGQCARKRLNLARVSLGALLLVLAVFGAHGQQARGQRVSNWSPVQGLRFYYVDPSFTTGTAVGPGFGLPALYAAEQAWKVDDLPSRIEFYGSGGPNSSMHVRGEDSLGGPIASASLHCPDAGPASCNLRFARGMFWYTGTGALPAGRTDQISVGLHEFGHLIGLRHADAELTSDTMPGWFHGPPAVGPQGANVVRRAVHTDDIQAARIARPLLSSSYKVALANGTFDLPIRYGPNGSSSSHITGWGFFNQSLPGATYFSYPGGYSSPTYMSFTSGASGTNTSVFQDFFFEPTAADGSPPTYMRNSTRGAAGWFRYRPARLVIWHRDYGTYQYVDFAGTAQNGPWTYRSIPNFVPPNENRHVRFEIYDMGPGGVMGYVDVDRLEMTWV